MTAKAVANIITKLLTFFVNGLLVFLLWNYFAPMFDFPIFGYWQSVGLVALTKTLFGSYWVSVDNFPD